MNRKKILFYAGVLCVIPTVCFASLVGSVSQSTMNSNEGGGCNRIYDVNRDTVINFQDAGLCWTYIQHDEWHCEYGDLLYDVNMDGQVNFQDCGLIWVNRD